MEAWTDRQKREAHRTAQLQLTVAMAGGMKRKGGGNLTLDDFLPKFAKPKKKKTGENELKAAFMAMAAKKETNG